MSRIVEAAVVGTVDLEPVSTRRGRVAMLAHVYRRPVGSGPIHTGVHAAIPRRHENRHAYVLLKLLLAILGYLVIHIGFIQSVGYRSGVIHAGIGVGTMAGVERHHHVARASRRGASGRAGRQKGRSLFVARLNSLLDGDLLDKRAIFTYRVSGNFPCAFTSLRTQIFRRIRAAHGEPVARFLPKEQIHLIRHPIAFHLVGDACNAIVPLRHTFDDAEFKGGRIFDARNGIEMVNPSLIVHHLHTRRDKRGS